MISALVSSTAPLTLAFLPGHTELFVILFVVLLLFGNKLPQMARALGSSFIEFKKGVRGDGENAAEIERKGKSEAGDQSAAEGRREKASAHKD